jgi:precorrin-6A synthase (deacetylating)
VDAWHDEIARIWARTIAAHPDARTVALLVWGDPSLYDSTLRIAARLDPAPRLHVVPGITSVQALTAAHAIPLNTLNAPVTISTGRHLRNHGWPADCETLVVMLDAECTFRMLDGDGFDIWWGAYLGMPEQILDAGRLGDVRKMRHTATGLALVRAQCSYRRAPARRNRNDRTVAPVPDDAPPAVRATARDGVRAPVDQTARDAHRS